tara:strand:- start:1067 stop:1615 length:549 start_codon:yes stop_codon:yes gene_type:complete
MSEITWSDALDFIKQTNISYVSKIIKSSSELNANLIEELETLFEKESIDAPFCNMGDVDLDDLESELPKGWTLRREKINLQPGEAMVVLAVFDYAAKRYFDLEDYENVEIVANDLGGCYPLSVDSEENPFMEDYQTSASERTILFNICWEEESFDEDCCSKEDFADRSEMWKAWLDEMNQKA